MNIKLSILKIAITSVLAICSLGVIIAGIKNYYSLKEQLTNETSNRKAYENMNSILKNDKRVLRLSVADLRDSNDKYIHSIDSLRKSLKLPKNKPGDVSTGISTTIHDTAYVELLKPAECDIDTTIIHNEFTNTRVILHENQLKAILDVNNTEYLYVYSSREFVNSRKGWLDRLLHLDYRKEDIERYEIVNTNDLIKVGDVRIIKTVDK